MSTTRKLRVALLGSHGRMGKHVTHLLNGEYSDRAELYAELTRGGNFEQVLSADVVLDFSSPAAVAQVAQTALDSPRTHWPCFVVGSTGFQASEKQVLARLSQKTPVLLSANFSIGIQVLAQALRQAAPLLSRWGFTPVLQEAHHQHKKDAPSGTALWLARAIDTNHPTDIQTHSIRAGEIIGEHSARFLGPAEELEFSHRATDRSIFARGALDVSLWIAKQNTTRTSTPGQIWTMDDFFGAQNSGA